jgi:hypothetical protein
VERRDALFDVTTLALAGGDEAHEPQFPHGMCNAAVAYASSAGTDVAAYDDLPGYHLLAARNLIATNERPPPPPATSHGYAEWDFSGVPDPIIFQRFLDAVDYWFGYSNTSSTGSHGPECECFMSGIGDVVDGANVTGDGQGEDPRTRG